LGALGTVGDLKFNRVTLFKGFEPFPLDGGVVNKYILATFNFDKPKTLPVIEPLYSSCHLEPPGIAAWVNNANRQYYLPHPVPIMYQSQKKSKMLLPCEKIKIFRASKTNCSLRPIQWETEINENLRHPGYILLWGRKTHPGQLLAPACDLFPKYPSSHGWLEHDRRRSSTPPPRFLHMPQNRNPYQNFCILEVSPWYPSFCPKQPIKPGQFLSSQTKINHSFF
jgi:hypothetical protein